jgi:UDP-N-acetylenolpyruvoylglucosamine reductase
MCGDGSGGRGSAWAGAGGAVSGPSSSPRSSGPSRLSSPGSVQRDYPLARLTTVRTGGPAELFARVGGSGELLELLGWARAEKLAVAVVGSGSNLLVADAGVRGLVIKLDGELAKIVRDDSCLNCGAGARLPAVAAFAARVGLAGIEFGVNIPGTVGGAVRMNANAYGGSLGEALEWVELATGSGEIVRRAPGELGFGYRSSKLGPGEIVTGARFRLREADVAEVKGTLARMRARRHEAQPQGIKTFGSTFKNPPARSGAGAGPGSAVSSDSPAEGLTAGQLLARAGCSGLRVGGARLSEKHANFVENTGTATTADVIAVMAQGRRRVLERFGIALEAEVQTLGDVDFPW